MLRKIALNSASQYVATAVGMAVTFFLTPFLVARLGRESMGLQTLASQALSFIGLFTGAMGLSYTRAATVRYAKGEYEEMNAVIGAGFWLSVVTGVLFLAGAWVMALYPEVLFGIRGGLVRDASWVIVISGLTSALLTMTGPWCAPLQLAQSAYWQSLGSIVATVVAAVVVVAGFRMGEPGVVFWVAVTNGVRVVVVFLMQIPAARRVVPQFRMVLSLENIVARSRSLMRLGVWSFFGGLGYLFYYATDSMLISNLDELGPGRIIDYNLGQRWDPIIRMLVAGFAGSLTPALTGMVARGEGERLKGALVSSTRYAVAGGLLPCVLLLVLAEPFITAWVGAGFAASSVPVLRIILVGTAVSLPTMIGYETLVALGKIGEAVISTLVGGICNVVLAVVLVKYFGWGLEGIALACVLTMGLRNLIYTPLLLIRHSGVGAARYYVEGVMRPMAGAVVLAGLVILIRMVVVPTSLAGVMGCFAVGTLLYVPVLWLVTFRPEDKALALRLWARTTERWRRPA
ncbi:MAG: Membrane protein involved in the export of O-antigen and teichoic acid [Verrucomicrobia bacterium]|nr:MAG: Membrane protein involved in the export of O-antigen and teichoic acid [Verrucomicrobiota bacterium]